MGKLFNKRFLVFLLSAGYLFVTLSHIPFIKRYNPFKADIINSVSIFKKQSATNALGSLKVLLKRIDKHLTKKSKAISLQVTLYSRSFFFLFTAPIQQVSVLPPVFVLNGRQSLPSVLCCFRL